MIDHDSEFLGKLETKEDCLQALNVLRPCP